MSAYTFVRDEIAAIIPSTWTFTDFEPIAEIPDVTSVTLKIRTVSPLPEAPAGAYQVDWIFTITSPYPSRETADPQLADDLIDFLTALDELPSWIVWTEATKTVGADEERLAYDITIRTHTQKEGA